MRWDLHDKERFILLCKEEYQENGRELRHVREFEEHYKSDRAIWWYTRESFICRMLNKAFQILNIDLLYYFHFLIRDIQRKLKEKKPSSPICAYRPQLMSNEDLQLLKNSIGELISINTFLLAMPNRDRALEILKNFDALNDLNRVLFEIDADPRPHDTKPFSDITSLNYFTGVESILFMVGTIFHPINIRKENNITIIHMETCRDSDKKLKVLFEQTKTEDHNDQTNLISLATILSKMKKFDDAEIYYLRVLNENPNDHHSIACSYRGLGNIAIEKDDYQSSIHFYRKALDTDRFILRPEDPEIASGYCALAYAYVQSGAYYDAHELYTEALQILIRGLDKDHPKVALCYKNMGCAFEMEKKYSEAINCYQKALNISEKTRSTDHLDTARLHNHMGNAYKSIDDLQKAFKHYNSALKIMTKSNSCPPLDVVATMKNMSHVLEVSGNPHQALAQLQKAATIQSEILPSNHPDMIKTTQDIQRLSSKLK
jgi:tetratricopeptide (TPR) repeat protein